MTSEPIVVYEDDNLIILDKPYGLTVNRSETTKNQQTLQDWIVPTSRPEDVGSRDPDQSVGKKLKIDNDSDFYRRSGIVHRLDKDTSGLIIIAKNPQAFANLQKQFKDRQVAKTYLALVWGKLLTDGEVKAPITRNPFNRKRFGIFVGGKEAHTSYRVLRNITIGGQEISLLEASPITGRTHQIRVHLSYIGHPLVGDPLYSGRKRGRVGLKMFGRLMLHAYKISFLDPKDNQRVEFKSEIPEEFKRLS